MTDKLIRRPLAARHAPPPSVYASQYPEFFGTNIRREWPKDYFQGSFDLAGTVGPRADASNFGVYRVGAEGESLVVEPKWGSAVDSSSAGDWQSWRDRLVLFITTSYARTAFDEAHCLYHQNEEAATTPSLSHSPFFSCNFDAELSKPVARPVRTIFKPAVEKELLNILREAHDAHFEDGVESAFTTATDQLLSNFGAPAVEAIDKIVSGKTQSGSVRMALLHALGRNRHLGTTALRRSTLVRQLHNAQLGIRDAAIVGLSYLCEPSAADDLRTAASTETSDTLRHEMLAVAEDLEAEGVRALSNKKDRPQNLVGS